MQFAEAEDAYTSSGDVKLGCQIEYLGTVIVLMERNASCIMSKALYLECDIR